MKTKGIAPMTAWIAHKIASFLTNHEGCQVATPEHLMDGTKVVCQDAFGFRYEVTIKHLSRAQTLDEGDRYDNPFKTSIASAISKIDIE